jgi:D-amino-acid dehydrogenase
MARTDAVVLGAGIVGTSIALHLAKRGLAVALVDRGGPGEGTSYGNAGVIEGNTLLPHPFPTAFGALMKVALKRATEANYHLFFLPRVAPWLLDYRANSAIERRIRFANLMRPLFGAALAEHEALMQESNATRYLRREGWLKVYRTQAGFAATARERELAAEFGLPFDALDRDGALALEPAMAPQFVKGIYWRNSASVTNPLALTRAYIARFTALGGVVLTGDARTLHRAADRWRVETDEGPVDAREAVVALGPWATDLLEPMDIDLPMAVKRGYHLHFRPRGNAGLTRPVVDAEVGYCVAPMEQGLRLTTGAEFADRDAPPTMPVIGRAPGQSSLWLAVGHAHWGLTLGPVTGRLLAEMMTGATPFCDPTPYAAERFTR